MTGVTWLEAEAIVPCRAEQADQRLSAVLGSAPAGSTRPASGVPMAVGPGWGRLHKEVVAHVGVPRQRTRTQIRTFGWHPTGRLARGFPTLDALVGVTGIDETTSLLTIRGHYVPPFGRLGGAVDRAVLRRLAESTLRRVARQLSVALMHVSSTVEEEARHESHLWHAPVGR